MNILFAQSVTLQVPIPELDSALQTCQGALCTGVGLYIAAAAKWLVGAISMLAVIFIMIGGLMWLTAAGSTQRVERAKKYITDALWGLFLALGSYMILFTINPNITELGDIWIRKN